jgi:hypothetical protein
MEKIIGEMLGGEILTLSFEKRERAQENGSVRSVEISNSGQLSC